MRLRNVPGADLFIANHSFVIKKPENYKGKWFSVFGNVNPIHIEIGMGKGLFILQQARKNPQINYIGIEMYSSVLQRALERKNTEEFEELQNIRFLKVDGKYLFDVFAKDEIDRIYLNFSDPWPKSRHAKRRLTSSEFLQRYELFLKPAGLLECKTDNIKLFRFSLEQLQKNHWYIRQYTYDLHQNKSMNEGNIQTEYEEKFSSLGIPINKFIASKSKS